MAQGKKYPIYYISFENRYLLTSTFLRFQEYYECPKFRNKTFTLEEYMDWYSEKSGEFTYYKDCLAFNIPSYILEPFYKGRFNPLTRKELALLRLLKGIEGKFYVIASVRGDTEVMMHEIIHGLFYSVPEYRKDVKRCLRRFNIREFKEVLVKEYGYHPSVALDEINAYLLTGKRDDINAYLLAEEKSGKERIKNIYSIRKRLRKIYRKHFGSMVGRRVKRKRILRPKIHRLKFKMRA